MFIGTYEHTIDEKSRLTLPARFRDALGEGVVLARGLDRRRRRLSAGDLEGERRGSASPRSTRSRGEARDLRTLLLLGGGRGGSRPPGSDPRPGRPHAPRRPRARGRRRGQLRPPPALEPRRLGAAPACRRRERRTCCRTSCRASDADHIPVLADEVRELLAVRPGETVVDATFGAGGHARLLAAGPRGPREARARSTATRTAKTLLRPLQGRRRRRRAIPARRLRHRPRPARGERRQGGRGPARPRDLVDAGRPARARLLVRDRRAARHAHGPVVRADGRRRSSTPGTSGSS